MPTFEMKIGETDTIEIATAGNPLLSFTRAMKPYHRKPHLLSIGVAHDDECPCVNNQSPLIFCSCEIIELQIKRLA